MKDINRNSVSHYNHRPVIEHDDELDDMETVQVDGIYVVERRKRVERRQRKVPVAFDRRTSCDRRDKHNIDIEI